MLAALSSDRLRLLTLTAIALLFLGSIAAFNFLEDPYGRLGQIGAIGAVKGTAANIPLACFVELLTVPTHVWNETDAVFLGDSRTRHFTEERVAEVAGRHVLNLALGGATLDESITMLSLEEARLPHLRTVIVGVPLERFAEAAFPNRCREAEPIARSPLRYLLNWQICEDSWAVFERTRELGHRPPKPPRFISAVDNGEGDAIFLSGWRGMYAAFDPQRVRDRLDLLHRTLAPFRARGVEIIYWAPSLRPDTRALIGEAGLTARWQEISAELQREAPFFDYTFADRLGSLPFTYRDPVHSLQGPKIAESLLSWH